DILHLVSEEFLAAPATRLLCARVWVGANLNANRTEFLVGVPVGMHQFMKQRIVVVGVRRELNDRITETDSASHAPRYDHVVERIGRCATASLLVIRFWNDPNHRLFVDQAESHSPDGIAFDFLKASENNRFVLIDLLPVHMIFQHVIRGGGGADVEPLFLLPLPR